MITVNHVGNRITGTVNGKPYSCSFSPEKAEVLRGLSAKAATAASMEELKAIIKEFETASKESYKELVESKTPYLKVNPASNMFYLSLGAHVSKHALPAELVKRIMYMVDRKQPVEPLIKAWARFLRPVPGRPKYTAKRGEEFAYYISAPYVDETVVSHFMATEGLSQEAAREAATTTQVSITEEGILMCYKVSEEINHKYALDENGNRIIVDRYEKDIDPDTGVIVTKLPEFAEDRVFQPAIMKQRGDNFYCEDSLGNKKLGHIIKVGHTHYLESWDQVSSPGSKGLHCGGLSYIKGYQGPGTETHVIFVDPSDIHTIYTSGDGVMTVKRYFVAHTLTHVNKAIYHSSTYAKMVDDEFEKLIAEVLVAEAGKNKEDVDALLAEAKATLMK